MLSNGVIGINLNPQKVEAIVQHTTKNNLDV